MADNLDTTKFWIVTLDGTPLHYRFQSLEEAQNHATELCKEKPNRVCYILESVECWYAITDVEIQHLDLNEEPEE